MSEFCEVMREKARCRYELELFDEFVAQLRAADEDDAGNGVAAKAVHEQSAKNLELPFKDDVRF